MEENEKKLNFLEEIIEEDLRTGKVPSILTRFPPEPNGYLHTFLHVNATTCVRFTAKCASFNTCTALAVSDTIQRNVPKSELSAMVMASRLMPAPPKILVTSVRRPDLFSKKIESCSIFIV